MSENTPDVAVIILNYNNAKDTIACAKSVLASTCAPRWLFIVDNASTDGSMEKICAWADNDGLSYAKNPCDSLDEAQMVFLESEENRGYAAGNNLGIKRALQWGAEAVWILNNDTEVEREALGAMYKALFSKRRPGLCGSTVCYMDTGLVQCCGGGKTRPWTGLSRLMGHNQTRQQAALYDEAYVERNINFIYGASVMASRDFIHTVGLMDERYFLYCEEQDWAYSAKGQFDFAYASSAIVHHKEGGTTEFNAKKMNVKSLWYLTRSRILLTCKHKAYALPTVCASILYAGLRMIARRIVHALYKTRSLPKG